jgi:hypothetical protein
LRGPIVVVQVGAVKIYLAAVEALRNKERQGETQEPRWFSEVHSPLNANVLFYRIFFESHPVYDQTQGTGAVFS